MEGNKEGETEAALSLFFCDEIVVKGGELTHAG